MERVGPIDRIGHLHGSGHACTRQIQEPRPVVDADRRVLAVGATHLGGQRAEAFAQDGRRAVEALRERRQGGSWARRAIRRALDHPQLGEDPEHARRRRPREPGAAGELAHADRFVRGHDQLQERERAMHRAFGA